MELKNRNNLFKQNNFIMSPKHGEFPPYSVEIIKLWVQIPSQAMIIRHDQGREEFSLANFDNLLSYL